jgi:DNA-binding GntR family transcriptional regulator
MVFHQTLVDAAGNTMLARTYAGLRVRQRRVGVAALFCSANRQRAVCGEHERIVEALAAGDEPAAMRAIDEHLTLTLRVLLEA